MLSFLKGKSLLYVDTGYMIGEVLEDYFNIHGAKLHFAKDGREGLEKYNTVKPDIVLSALMIPHLNGIEMLKRIREDNQDAVIILFSPKMDIHIAEQAKYHDISVLYDPFILSDLVKMLQEKYQTA